VKRSYTSTFLKTAPQNLHDDEIIATIQDLMHGSFHTPLRLEELAAQSGISVRSLNRRFRRATGRTPMQYLQQIRLDNAKELLRASNLSIAEVAFNSGFADCSYFSAQFKKAVSLSPRSYRDLVRRKLFAVQENEGTGRTG
jgi:transcriptional regulator GlxA family with amidase domain